MPASQIIAFSNAVVNDNTTQMLCPAHTINGNSTANEVLSQMSIREDGVIDQMVVNIQANAITASSAVTLRKNLADAAGLTVTVGASQTGKFYDLSGSHTVASADEIAWKIIAGEVVGSVQTINVKQVTFRFTPTDTGKTIHWSYTGGSGTTFNVASGTRYVMPTGTINPSTVEAESQAKLYGAFTSRNLVFNVNTNARTTDTTIRTRINGANGAQSVVVGASQTGLFEDAVNSDTLASGDLFCYSVTTGTGTQSLTSRWLVTTMSSTASQWAYYCGNINGTPLSSVGGTDYYAALSGNLAQAETVEGPAEVYVSFAHTVSQLSVYVALNTSSTASAVTLRVNNVSSALTAAVGAGQTGRFEDTIHSVSLAVADVANWLVDITSGTGSTQFQIINALAEVAGASGATGHPTMRRWGGVPHQGGRGAFARRGGAWASTGQQWRPNHRRKVA